MSIVFAHLGWTWLLVALGTTTVALALAAWRTWRPADSPQAQHRLAVGALCACLVILAVAPIALIAGRGQAAPAASAAETPRTPSPAAATAPVNASPQPGGPSPETANTIARAVGAVWMLAAAFMLTRLAGGCLVVHQLAGRARPSDSPLMRGVVDRLRAKMRVRTPVRICESPEIDVPIIVGLAPVLIVPPELALEPAVVTLEPLLAHELAHVERHDYLLNMVQSIVDALMVAFPGARWISGRIRETREYCCDEIALEVCGDRRGYVEALAGIATLSVARQPVAALGVGGPRLATRIRRLLHGDPEVHHRWARLTVLAAAATVAVVVCDRAADFAATRLAAQVQQVSAQGPETGGAFKLTMSFSYQQPGSAIVIARSIHGVAFACDSASVTNNANVAVTGLAFVAVAELWDAQRHGPVQIFTTDEIPVAIAPGATADVTVRLLAQHEWVQLGAIAPNVQVHCALRKVTYANGAIWEVTPNPAARTADAALSLPPAEVPRSLLSAAPTPGFVCRDDRGGEYSMGALVPIRNEPGTLARCADVSSPETGERAVRWVDDAATPRN